MHTSCLALSECVSWAVTSSLRATSASASPTAFFRLSTCTPQTHDVF